MFCFTIEISRKQLHFNVLLWKGSSSLAGTDLPLWPGLVIRWANCSIPLGLRRNQEDVAVSTTFSNPVFLTIVMQSVRPRCTFRYARVLSTNS